MKCPDAKATKTYDSIGYRGEPVEVHYTKVRDAGLMSCGRSVGLPSRSAGGVGGGPLGVKGLCRAAPAASAGAEADPHPTSPASGGGGFRRLSAWVPVNDLWYYSYDAESDRWCATSPNVPLLITENDSIEEIEQDLPDIMELIIDTERTLGPTVRSDSRGPHER